MLDLEHSVHIKEEKEKAVMGFTSEVKRSLVCSFL